MCAKAQLCNSSPAPVARGPGPVNWGCRGVPIRGAKAPCAHGGVPGPGSQRVGTRRRSGAVHRWAPRAWVRVSPEGGGGLGGSRAAPGALHQPLPGVRVWRGRGSEDVAGGCAGGLCGDHAGPSAAAAWAGEHQQASVRPSIHPCACVCLGVTVCACDLLTRTLQGERAH